MEVTIPPAVTSPPLFGGNARLAIKMISINFIKVTEVFGNNSGSYVPDYKRHRVTA